MSDFDLARRHMVDCQIRTNRVTDDALLAAMRQIPRERFVEPAFQGVAYLDEDLPLGGGRALMEPMVLARLIQALQIGPGDVVLDVGCASGYSSAVVARLAATVVALEADPGLAGRATEAMVDLGIDNVVVVEGKLAEGYASQAPYDAILLGGAVPEIPRALSDQVAEGGRLATVIDAGRGPGRAVSMIRRGGVISSRALFDANILPLPGFESAPGFVF